MGRALGSTQTHEAMDALMDRMMCETASGQMYRHLGERYLGKNIQPDSRSLPMYGWMANMMSAYRGHMPYAGMMNNYLRGSGGGYSMMGHTGMMSGYSAQSTSGSGRWPTGAIILVAVLGGLLLAKVLAVTVPRLRPSPRHACRETDLTNPDRQILQQVAGTDQQVVATTVTKAYRPRNRLYLNPPACGPNLGSRPRKQLAARRLAFSPLVRLPDSRGALAEARLIPA